MKKTLVIAGLAAASERNRSINLSRKWNRTSTMWLPFDINECGGQADDLAVYLNTKDLKYWWAERIGGYYGDMVDVLGLRLGISVSHNVVEMSPKAGNPLPSFTLDPFHGPQNWNLGRDVKVGTPEEFNKKYYKKPF